MVVLSQKVGTLCIEYRPPETTKLLVDDDGIFSTDDVDEYILFTKFYPGYVPLLPIYALDPRCFSQMRIKCYSLFDAVDFIEHLDLRQYEFRYAPSKTGTLEAERDEFDIERAEFEGSLENLWTIRIAVSQKDETIILSNRENYTDTFKNLKLIYARNQ